MRLFITGTDTGVGKTFVSCLLLQALHRRGIAAIGMKPVAAGVNDEGLWDDVEHIRRASALEAPMDEVCPYRLRAAASPHFAAEEERVSVRAEVILAALERLERRAEWVVIEGVGGFRVPLSPELDTAMLAQAIGAPLVLVVAMRLGCINHALLTAESIAQRGLTLAAWVANAGTAADYPRVDRTIETITAAIKAPCAGAVPYLASGTPAGEHLDIARLVEPSKAPN
jgi:dethiobiotin synthetase